jgi:NAD(P)-dependent dehydrogenase (short-subunit alcohol dehydrogenase family)
MAICGHTRPGAIVINASVNAIRPEVHFADYNASKAAAANFAATLAMEWSAEGSCVTCLCHGSSELLTRIPVAGASNT